MILSSVTRIRKWGGVSGWGTADVQFWPEKLKRKKALL
jgi:hypothetical protein